jgi:hypothetical protein
MPTPQTSPTPNELIPITPGLSGSKQNPFGRRSRMALGPSELQRLSHRYAAFARDEARGASVIYEKLALGVAASPELLSFIASLPPDRRQPNLFLAAIRHLYGVPQDADRLVALVREHQGPIRALMQSRTTQTNEPARCAVLLPILAQLPQPLALLEVGASAGLCLLPDRYGYDYGMTRIAPVAAAAPVFRCVVNGSVPLPARAPEIVWRLGLDLNPIDLRSNAAVEWLETLVWPDQPERAQRLRAAIEVGRSDPPRVVQGDLLTDLEPLIATAPKDATLVVFHTAVLAYVTSQVLRDHFAQTLRRSGAVWISNEAPGAFPAHATLAPPAPARGRFLLMRDTAPVAWTGPHGQSIDWFGPT